MMIRRPEDKQLLEESGRRLCEILSKLKEKAKPGVDTQEFEDYARELVEKNGDSASFLNYHPRFAPRPYPAAVCVSLNDEIVHGIPNENSQVLKEGDVVSFDMGVTHQGLITDSAVTVPVGKVSSEVQALLKHTEEALFAGIEAAQPGNRIGDIGHAIESIAKKHGYGIPKNLCGHGVGYQVHAEPNIPNYGTPGSGVEIVPGMILALEPMFILGGSGAVIDDADGYTVRSADGSISAHFEHTIFITEDGPKIITQC